MPYVPSGGSVNPVDEGIVKYQNKLNHLVLRLKMGPIIQDAHNKAGQSFANNTYVLKMVKPLLDQTYMAREIRPLYYAYGNSLYASQRNLSFMVDWIREHQVLRARWEARGLDHTILDKIDVLLIIHRSPDG